MSRFLSDLSKLKQETGCTDDEWNGFFGPMLDKKLEESKDALVKRYGAEVVNRGLTWGNESLSPMELGALSAEDILFKYAEENPGELSREELSRFLGKEKPKALLRDPFSRPLDVDRLDVDERGAIFEKAKPDKVFPPTPSDSQMRKMSSKDVLKAFHAGGGKRVSQSGERNF